MTIISISTDEKIYKDFEMALQLNSETKDEVINTMIRDYISRTFSRIASSYKMENSFNSDIVGNNASEKATRKMHLWAKKTTQVPHKIIRAFLQLKKENDIVTYDMLAARCNDQLNHPDVYVPTFSSNFTQMKFDSEKSHGKVFELDDNNVVSLWNKIEPCIEQYKKAFILHTTDVGYINNNKLKNLGCTGKEGTDHLQYFYKMQCQKCGAIRDDVNGTNIYEAKCSNPNCK